MDIKELMEYWGAEKSWEIGNDIYVSHKLIYHYALLVNPNRNGYEHRYCYKDLALMERAMEAFKKTKKLRFWHKDHTRGICVKGKYLYPNGQFQIPEYAIGEVDWTV